MLQTFFRYKPSKHPDDTRIQARGSMARENALDARRQFKKFDFSLFDQIRFTLFTLCLSRRSQKKKLLEKGMAQLETALDTRTIIRY